MKYMLLVLTFIFAGTWSAWAVVQIGEGAIKRIDQDGHLLAFIQTKNLTQHGPTFEYYLDGEFRLQAEYEEGVLDGVSRGYYEDTESQAKYMREFRQGLRDGMSRLYYPNGALKLEIMYGTNIPIGKAYLYDEEGHVIQEDKYYFGRRVYSKIFSAGGELINEFHFSE